ncbi:MAG: hypothetical protein J7K77_01835 [Dehalococcoidales bacterium]|nr:hypothetical protein [Dehalococcoidales bacterium]
MINDVLSILKIIDRVLEKRKASTEQRNRDKVLVSIYKLGSDGGKAVSPSDLEKCGFLKKQIFGAIEAVKSQDWINDVSSHDGVGWMLKRNAIYYVEGLLESKEAKKYRNS